MHKIARLWDVVFVLPAYLYILARAAVTAVLALFCSTLTSVLALAELLLVREGHVRMPNL